MKEETLRKIELDEFDNRIGLEIGLAIIQLAKERNKESIWGKARIDSE